MITPIMVNGRLLVDGAVLNPVPMEPVTGVDADFTLAVALAGDKPRSFSSRPAKETSAQRPPNEWLDRFVKSAAGVWENDVVTSILARFGGKSHEFEEPAHLASPPAFEPPPPGVRITDVTAMALDTMGSLITRFRLAALPPDVLVTVPGDAAKTMDFHRAVELIALGRRLTEAALDEAFADEGSALLQLKAGTGSPEIVAGVPSAN